MQKIQTQLTATALFLSLAAGTAQAAFIATPPVRVSDSAAHGRLLECAVENVGTTDVEIAISATAEDLVVVPPQIIPPGETRFAHNVNSGPGARSGWCRFNVLVGKKKHVRGSACALDDTLNCRAALPAN